MDYNPNTPEAIKALANNIVPEGTIPTHGNSTKVAAPATPAELDSPAFIGNLSC